MNKIISIFLICSICLAPFTLSFCKVNANAATSEHAIFSMLDMSKLPSVKAAYDIGDYEAALDAYKIIIIDRLRQFDFVEFPWHDAYNPNSARLWANKITYEQYKQQFPNSEPRAETCWILPNGEIDWLALPTNSVVPDQFWFRYFTDFVNAYLNDGTVRRDPIYVQKWLSIMSNYALNNKTTMEAQVLLGNVPASDYRSWQYNNNFIFSMQTRVKFILSQFAGLAKMLPNNEGVYPAWANILTPSNTTLPQSSYDIFDSEQVADLAVSLMKDHIPYLIDWYVDSTAAVPNQRHGGLDALAMSAAVFSDFNIIDNVSQKTNDGYVDYFSRSMYPDGAFIEQAFNYNLGELSSIESMRLFSESTGKQEPFIETIVNSYDYAAKLFVGLKRPIGGNPSVGMGGINQSGEFWKTSGENTLKSSSAYDVVPQSSYTSIGFPYAGYYAMRSGWNVQDTYLFVQATRNSRGHLYPSYNSLEIVSNGRNLLMAGGAPWYFITDCPTELQAEYDNFNKYFSESSSFDRNTVIVDGKSQLKEESYTNLQGVPTTNNLFYTDENYDVFSSVFTGAYGEPIIRDVTHQRDIFYHKGLNMFFVTDKMESPNGHMYSQLWNFPPKLSAPVVYGFGEGEVNSDVSRKTIKTTSTDGPNIAIHQSTAEALTYNKYFGSESGNVYLGWYSPGTSGARFPKVDIHTEFSGEKPLVSVIVPNNSSKDYTTSDMSNGSISATQVNYGGICAKMYSSKLKSILGDDNFIVTAKNALVSTKNTQVNGVVLGGSAGEMITVGGISAKIPCENFVFRVTDNKIVFSPVASPTKFEYSSEGVPAYYNDEIISSEPVIESSTSGTNADVFLTNTGVGSKSASLLLCAFDEFELKNISIADASLSQNEAKTLGLSQSASTGKFKAFVWRDLNSIVPIKQVIPPIYGTNLGKVVLKEDFSYPEGAYLRNTGADIQNGWTTGWKKGNNLGAELEDMYAISSANELVINNGNTPFAFFRGTDAIRLDEECDYFIRWDEKCNTARGDSSTLFQFIKDPNTTSVNTSTRFGFNALEPQVAGKFKPSLSLLSQKTTISGIDLGIQPMYVNAGEMYRFVGHLSAKGIGSRLVTSDILFYPFGGDVPPNWQASNTSYSMSDWSYGAIGFYGNSSTSSVFKNFLVEKYTKAEIEPVKLAMFNALCSKDESAVSAARLAVNSLMDGIAKDVYTAQLNSILN